MAVFGNSMMVFNRNTAPLIPLIPLNNFISYWKFDGNSNDSVGSNNGTPTSITYSTGLIGQAAVFNGTTSKVVVPDAANLSFGNGTSDVDFSTICLIKIANRAAFPRIFIKVNADGTQAEYLLTIFNDKARALNIDASASASIRTDYGLNLVQNTYIVVTTTYKASTKDLKIYVNNSVYNIDSNSGVYTAMEIGTGNLSIGFDPRSSGSGFLDGEINALALLNVELTVNQVADVVERYLTDNRHLI